MDHAATSREHVTDGSPCWCDYRVTVLCRECDDPCHANPDCWACGGEGLVDALGFEDVPTITIHSTDPRPDPPRLPSGQLIPQSTEFDHSPEA